MLSRFADLPPGVQDWILGYFSSPDDADRWLHERDPDLGCSPLQLLEFPPGLSRLPDIMQARRARAAATRDNVLS